MGDQGSAIDQDLGPPISGDSNNNYKTIKSVCITFASPPSFFHFFKIDSGFQSVFCRYHSDNELNKNVFPVTLL